MSSVRARRLAVSMIVLSVALLCSCSGSRKGGESAGESLFLPFLVEDSGDGWTVGNATGDEVQRITEFVRPNESVETWTEMITAQTLNKAADLGSVGQQMTMYEQDLASRCPGSAVEVIREMADGMLYEASVVNCQQGGDEQILGRVIDGTSNRFVLHYSVRGAKEMTAERRSEWTEKLMAVKIMNM